MTRLVTVATILAILATPLAAQSLSVLLPALTYPEPVPTPSTKDCPAPPAAVCPPGQ